MTGPVRVEGQRAIQFKLEDDTSPSSGQIKDMIKLARDQFGANASLSKFEFRLKKIDGEQYLELREQSWFGRLKEAMGKRKHERIEERHEALNLLSKSYGDGIFDVLFKDERRAQLGASSALNTRKEARELVSLADKGILDSAPSFSHSKVARDKLKEAGFQTLQAAMQNLSAAHTGEFNTILSKIYYGEKTTAAESALVLKAFSLED